MLKTKKFTLINMHKFYVLISIAINMKKAPYDGNTALLIGYISLDMYGCMVNNKIIN